MIFSYNKQAVGDTLLVIVQSDRGEAVTFERKETISRVFIEATGETVAWNFFQISDTLTDLTGNGQIYLTAAQVAQMNDLLAKAGFSETLELDESPKIVTGFVKSCVKHPDSDHLSITETEVGDGEVLQIVCGASNIKAGLTVVVAKPGAMMPDGLVIWPGELRGVASHGMICSARELGVPNAPTAKGILELPAETEIGIAFKAASN